MSAMSNRHQFEELQRDGEKIIRSLVHNNMSYNSITMKSPIQLPNNSVVHYNIGGMVNKMTRKI